MVKKIFLTVFLVLVWTGGFLSADEVDELLTEVDSAVEDESYTRAISLLEGGKNQFPLDYRLSERAGDLYLARNLHRLALAEYRRARELDPSVLSLLSDIAMTQGYLGNNDAAVGTLEELFYSLNPDESSDGRSLRDSTIDDLSWMYFKTHRIDDGIRLLEVELEGGFDMYWAHTLGTLYSGIYNLEESRLWYQRSIDSALERGDFLFASIAHYNLSLLEFTFYRYEEARDHAMRSLELQNRAGGHLVVGELDFMAWDLENAIDSYRQAESLDETPLARADMADFYLRTGYPDEALRFVDEAEGSGDESWMYRFGLDSVRFGMDLSRVRSDALRGKAEVEALTPRSGLGEIIGSWIRRTGWKLQSMYHDRRNRSLTGTHARKLREEGNSLDAAWNSASAYEGYRRQALNYLEEARTLETVFAPESGSWYFLEIGVESRDREMVARALESFNPLEGDPRERSLRELALLSRRSGKSLAGRQALASLYQVNPGGLRQYGLALPVAVVVSGEIPSALGRRVKGLLRKSGYRIVDADNPGPDVSVLRVISGGEGKLKWYMEDPEGRPRASAESAVIPRRAYLAPILAGLLNGFYVTPLHGAAP